MRRIQLAFVFLILFSCNKHSVDPSEIRLQKITSTNTSNSDVFIQAVEYDSQDRIVKVSDDVNQAGPVTSCTINYVNDQIIINVPIGGLTKAHDLRFIENGEGLPTKRIEYDFFEFVDAYNGTQQTKTYDTTYFEYNASGLLSKTTQVKIDSTNVSGGISSANLTVDRSIYTTVFTNEGNRLKSSVMNAVLNHLTIGGGNYISFYSTTEETKNFDYSKSYTNQFDFSNTIILNERLYIFGSVFYTNKNYSAVPNKINVKTVDKNMGGNITNSSDGTFNYEIQYSKHGFISAIKSGSAANSSTRTITYNK